MGDEAINALECLKSWYRDGLISARHEEIALLEGTMAALARGEKEKDERAAVDVGVV